MTILAQKSFAKCMAFLLANKLSSPTLLGTQLTRLITDAYSNDEVCSAPMLTSSLSLSSERVSSG